MNAIDGNQATEIEVLRDKIEGLQADLDNAVEVAFERGASEWVRMNYPDHFARLSAPRNHAFSGDWYRPSSCMLCSFKRDHPIHIVAAERGE